MSFKEFQFDSNILKALEEAGIEIPTPVQAQSMPLIMEGHDLRGSAQTGTGKTLAYMLPILERLAKTPGAKKNGPRILILVPTRELAIQIAAEAEKYSKFLSKIKTVCIYGGTPFPLQNRQLSRPYEILVATPGRLIDHMERGRIDLSSVEVLILDEADRMLDMGFIEPVEIIAEATPEKRQTLLFSATMKGSVIDLSKKLLKQPLEVSVAAEHARHENIDQRLYYTDDLRHKQDILNHLVNDPVFQQTIIFTSTKRFAEQLSQELYDQGCHAAALHGDMNQRERTRTISRMRRGEIKVLVATDVAARGIDIPSIDHVINFDLPNNAEDYVHRIGRTGRAANFGRASSLASFRDRHLVTQIEKYTGQKIADHVVEGMEPKTSKSKPAGRSFKSNPKPMGVKSNYIPNRAPNPSRGSGNGGFRSNTSYQGNRETGNRDDDRGGFNRRASRGDDHEFSSRAPQGNRDEGDRAFRRAPRGDQESGNRGSFQGNRDEGDKTFRRAPREDREFGNRSPKPAAPRRGGSEGGRGNFMRDRRSSSNSFSR